MTWSFPLNCKSCQGVGIIEISLKAGRWCDYECELTALVKEIEVPRSAMAQDNSDGGRPRGITYMDSHGS